jgi:hypothetical protein
MLPTVLKGALIGLPPCGLIAVVMLGRAFEFQLAASNSGAVARRRRMWFFGSWIDAQHVAVVGVRVKPGYGSNPADRIQVNLLDSGCDVILQVADEASDGQDVGSVLALALQSGYLLDKPIRLDGEGRADGGPLEGCGSTVASQNGGDLSAPAGKERVEVTLNSIGDAVLSTDMAGHVIEPDFPTSAHQSLPILLSQFRHLPKSRPTTILRRRLA